MNQIRLIESNLIPRQAAHSIAACAAITAAIAESMGPVVPEMQVGHHCLRLLKTYYFKMSITPRQLIKIAYVLKLPGRLRRIFHLMILLMMNTLICHFDSPYLAIFYRFSKIFFFFSFLN